jgi:hypothetical protein
LNSGKRLLSSAGRRGTNNDEDCWVEDSWWLKPTGHFSDDEARPDPIKAAALAG